ncbi:hypothetical protein V5799_010778 [Amblyomma americanum]|uniref:Uncharacterized protein n=1 Tax=Amblyomma americanum TaxID=6943 RepID=A0AAQ4EJ57_AMBAM
MHHLRAPHSQGERGKMKRKRSWATCSIRWPLPGERSALACLKRCSPFDILRTPSESMALFFSSASSSSAEDLADAHSQPISPDAANTANGHDDLSERTPQDDLAGYGADSSVDPDSGTEGADYVASTCAGSSRSSSSTETSAASLNQAPARRGISFCIWPDEGFELLEQLYRLPQSLSLPECIRAPVLLGGGPVQGSGGHRVSAVRRALSTAAAH